MWGRAARRRRSQTLETPHENQESLQNFHGGGRRPGWTIEALSDALVGRSPRSKPGKAKLAEVIDRSKSILGIPDGWRLGIVPASDTGAVEMVLWAMLGARGVDMLAWRGWAAFAAPSALAVCLGSVFSVAPFGAPFGPSWSPLGCLLRKAYKKPKLLGVDLGAFFESKKQLQM